MSGQEKSYGYKTKLLQSIVMSGNYVIIVNQALGYYKDEVEVTMYS